MQTTDLLAISKELGVVDLPIKIRGLFARALKIEREEGQTTTEAMNQLVLAINAETELRFQLA